ncbi:MULTISPECIES: phenylacetic acid degradation protein PaaN [unclassified Rhizobium]|uniref:phenylacetic acid degradation protein PaaN n=1 Tax=unclassified Rhizobium TaxID=2613769 RepID=UPI00161BAF26|nr:MULTISPECIES: phenylacetic acid degradation protein PaaN [unclassified Rhizobium]MBB3318736.1 phenylacetic acid degradation protein paaN [Rhizobium sp. BK181]MBB3543069.1 phenylacetic acid degradation protein paaN [Rhizobium sp. BK399]MCS3742285.1 phenylacetic acid degradation protein paaN [Rhizobium sp. BK661]MCS4094887.1 phenylacetic acid degradation protein paaN [Rhizobium sp. BK176]
MDALFDRYQPTLVAALKATQDRGYWSAYPEIPSGKIYGETAKDDGLASYNAQLGRPFDLPGHPGSGIVGAEVSPFGPSLGVTYPAADANSLIAASQAAASAWATAPIKTRVGVCLEVLARLNHRSFEIANAVMHTTGQSFAMAFQAGGPHAQDRGLEAVAYAYAEMSRTPAQAVWSKPQGKAEPIVLQKHWRVVPRGVSLVIGCQTFPTWNSYPGLFASLATGNTVIVKPHPGAILPLAITISVIRQVLAEEGFDRNIALLAPDAPGAEITAGLVQSEAVSIIDYTGSSSFGEWVRRHAGEAKVYTEETGVNSVVVATTDDFAGMCANIAFSLSLYSGQMCTAPQNIYVPRSGIATNQGHKGFEDVAKGIASAIDDLLADPARANGVCGAIANSATLARIETARGLGTLIRDSAPIDAGDARTATPLILGVDAEKTDAHEEERFGPIAFVVAVADAAEGIERAASLARRKGAITAALYDTDDTRIENAVNAFCNAGVNLSINLTGGIFVNQSAAFSDFHVTGANPAGNASLTDAAFVAERFSTVMWRQPRTV